MSSLEVVRSVPEDAEEIGRIRAANWEEQYANLDDETAKWMRAEIERISGPEGTSSRAYWIERALQPGAQNYWLSGRAAGSSAIIGFLEARKYEEGMHKDGTQELRSLHLLPGQRGCGVGQAFIDKAHQWLDPSREIFLYVVEANKAAQRFYRRSPNNYELTGRSNMHGPFVVSQMARPPQS